MARLLANFILPLIALAAAMAFTQSPAPQAVGSTTQTESYLLGAEDVIQVTVLRHPELSGDYLVARSGAVDVIGVGEIIVTGKSLEDVRTRIKNSLGKTRLIHPEVNVSLKLARLQRFYVIGDVKLGGVFDVKPNWTVAQALASGGGLALDVQPSDVTVTVQDSNGVVKEHLPLLEALARPDSEQVTIKGGDRVRFDGLKLIPINVSGRVKNPGVYKVRSESSNVIGAVSLAGGTLEDASLKLQILHLNGKSEYFDMAPALVRGEKATSPDLVAGDTVIVPVNLRRFSVLGFVSKPGMYPLEDGKKIRLTEAIAIGGGESERKGKLSHVAVVHVDGDREVRKFYNLNKYLQNGDLSQNPFIESGDLVYVPNGASVDILTLGSFAAGIALLFHL